MDNKNEQEDKPHYLPIFMSIGVGKFPLYCKKLYSELKNKRIRLKGESW